MLSVPFLERLDIRATIWKVLSFRALAHYPEQLGKKVLGDSNACAGTPIRLGNGPVMYDGRKSAFNLLMRQVYFAFVYERSGQLDEGRSVVARPNQGQEQTQGDPEQRRNIERFKDLTVAMIYAKLQTTFARARWFNRSLLCAVDPEMLGLCDARGLSTRKVHIP